MPLAGASDFAAGDSGLAGAVVLAGDLGAWVLASASASRTNLRLSASVGFRIPWSMSARIRRLLAGLTVPLAAMMRYKPDSVCATCAPARSAVIISPFARIFRPRFSVALAGAEGAAAGFAGALAGCAACPEVVASAAGASPAAAALKSGFAPGSGAKEGSEGRLVVVAPGFAAVVAGIAGLVSAGFAFWAWLGFSVDTL